MKKLIIAAVVILVILGAVYFLAIAPAPATAALLYVERGAVEVDKGSGWQPGTDEMELTQGSKVRTTDGEASVVFYEGEILHLEANSEITVSELTGKKITIAQTAGETWNKITKISGVSEYTVETANTVATVRGTEFSISDDELDVTDGEVDYGHKDKKDHIKVGKGKRALAKLMQSEDMSEDKLARMKQFPGKYANILKRVRAREIKKHKTLLKAAESKGMTEEKLQQELNDVDDGKENEDKLYQQVPSIMKPRAQRTYLLTKEIKRAKARTPQ